MRFLLILVFALMPFTLSAQQSNLCQGKQVFDLGGGASGCVVKIGTSSIRETRTRDDGQGSRSRSKETALIAVAAYGAFDASVPLTTNRVRGICQAFRAQALTQVSDSARSIIVEIIWPDAPKTSTSPSRTIVMNDPVIRQAAYTSRSCGSIRYFD